MQAFTSLIARNKPGPYKIIYVQTKDIKDWKAYSQKRGILRVRSSVANQRIDWTQFREVQILKEELIEIRFKYSHLNDEFDITRLTGAKRSIDNNRINKE